MMRQKGYFLFGRGRNSKVVGHSEKNLTDL